MRSKKVGHDLVTEQQQQQHKCRYMDIYISSIFFIHLAVNRHLVVLFLASVNNATVNMGVQICLGDPDIMFLGYISRMRLLNHSYY